MIGLAPVLTMLLSWAPGGQLQPWAVSLRSMALPIIGAELFVIAIAARDGMYSSFRTRLGRLQVMLPLAALLTIMFYTAIFVAPARPAAIIHSVIWCIHLLFGLSVAQLCGKHFERENLVTSYMIGFMLFVALFALFAAQVTSPEFDWTHALPAVTHVRHYGYYAAAIIAVAFGRMAATRSRPSWAAAFIVCLTGFGFAFWTGARGAVVAAVGGYIVGAALFPLLRSPRAWLGFLVAGAMGASLAYAIPIPDSDLMGVTRTVEATVRPEFGITTGRTDMWRGVLTAIAKSPIIGWGEGQMPVVASFYGLIQPHNIALQVVLAWGLAGALCILWLAAPFAWRSIGWVRASPAPLIAPAMGMIVIAAYSLLDGTLFHIQPVSIFAACVGMVAAGAKAKPAGNPAPA